MRRIPIAVLASSLLALALPAAAAAHHTSHHAAHHARFHRRHHRHAHTVVIAPAAKPAGSTGTGTTTTTTTTTTEPAATVLSFENGILKLTLADGSMVSGKVTESTEVECGCPGHELSGESPQFQHEDSQGQDGQGEDNGGPGQFHGDDEQGPQQSEGSCGVSALVAGAKIKEAELSIGSAGAVWEKIELLPSS
jgi:hypothetical protein